MTKTENLIQCLLDKRVLVCAGLMFSMTLTTGFISNRHVTIAVDGNTVELNTPYRATENILSQAGVTTQDEDEIQVSYDEQGEMVLTVKRAVPVTINFEGNTTELMTAKATVEDVLSDLGYVGNGYVIDQQMAEPIESGMIINVSEYKPVVEPANIVSTYHGDLEYQQHMTMEATAYLPSDGNGDGITATGVRATRGVVAVDPNYIPLGTRLYIPGYGFAVAADTGGAIRGDRIDLCMEGYSEAIHFGRRDVDVYVLK